MWCRVFGESLGRFKLQEFYLNSGEMVYCVFSFYCCRKDFSKVNSFAAPLICCSSAAYKGIDLQLET